MKPIRILFNFSRILSSVRSTMDRPAIYNFAFVDLETTGLPSEEYNKTRITELCITIVESRHVELGVYPRVRNKLNMCFQPLKMINKMATEITGLANDIIENQPSFSLDVVAAINNFLSLQKAPICLVAHNGNRFDYPILQAEINRVGGSLSQDLLCIDSLVCFQDLHKLKEEASKKQEEIATSKVSTQIPIEFSDGFDKILCAAVDEYEESIKNIQKINEKTPKRQIIPSSAWAQGSSRSISTSSAKRQRLSFKLPDIYRRLTQKDPENSHHAEGDVDCLIHCAAVYGEDFVEWANKNAKLFSEIPPMRPGFTIGY